MVTTLITLVRQDNNNGSIVTKEPKSCTLASHLVITKPNFNETTILETDPNYQKRLFLEISQISNDIEYELKNPSTIYALVLHNINNSPRKIYIPK